LIDVRNQLDRYVSPNRVDWHFAHINNRWTKRALVSAGFGYPSPINDDDLSGAFGRWKPIFSVAEIGGKHSVAAEAEAKVNKQIVDEEAARIRTKSQGGNSDQIERHDYVGDGRSSDDSVEYAKNIAKSKAYNDSNRVAIIHGINRPLFHIDLTSALQSAITNAQKKEAEGYGEREEDFSAQTVPAEH
jgi:solute carrier family 26 (sodium-independent sulfate anion transporter), member 11